MADANTLSSAESTQLWQVPQCIDFTFIGISHPGEEAICSVIHIKRLSYDRMKEIPLKKKRENKKSSFINVFNMTEESH